MAVTADGVSGGRLVLARAIKIRGH